MKLKSLSVLMLLSSTVAVAGEKVDKTLDVKSDGLVQVENVRGHIEVVGWDSDKVQVTGELDDQTEKFTFETSGATTTVKVKLPNHFKGGDGSELVIHMPRNGRLRTDVVSTDLKLHDIQGSVEARSVSGNIDANNLKKRIELVTVSGTVRVEDSAGRFTLSSVSGDIQGKNLEGEVASINTVSGDADVEMTSQLKEIKLNGVSGNIRMTAALGKDARVEGSTVSGDLRLKVNKDLDAVINLSTAAGGDIENHLSDERPKSGMFGNAHLEFTLGSGSGEIDLSTVSGKLVLQPL